MTPRAPRSLRVVAHTCSNTEIVCALGMGHCLVGVDSDSDYPGAILAPLPKLGRDLNLDIAAVFALRPNLVLSSGTLPGHDGIVQNLRAAGLNTLVCAPQRLSDVYDDIHRIATALGVPERGEALVNEMKAAMPPVNRSTRRPKVMVEWWPKPVIVPTRDSWFSDVIALAGGENAFEHRQGQSSPVTDDEVFSAAPDVVVMSWCGVPAHNYREEIVSRRAGWALRLPAVRKQQIHGITEAHLGRPGPRLVEGYRALRKILEKL